MEVVYLWRLSVLIKVGVGTNAKKIDKISCSYILTGVMVGLQKIVG